MSAACNQKSLRRADPSSRESYRLWCVKINVITKTSTWGGLGTWGLLRYEKKNCHTHAKRQGKWKLVSCVLTRFQVGEENAKHPKVNGRKDSPSVICFECCRECTLLLLLLLSSSSSSFCLSFTLREERRLKGLENRVLRRLFEPKRDEVTGEWRRIHNKELYALYSTPNIIRLIKKNEMGRECSTSRCI